MKDFIERYIQFQKQTLDTISPESVSKIIDVFKRALDEERTIFVFGNGGSAANASHFVTDLGKGSSDKTKKRFRCLSLNDNTPWMTALGNDYSYDDVFVRQLMNFAKRGDLLFTMSVSGNSPNLVKAIEWGKANGLSTVSLVGKKRGKLAEISDLVVPVEDEHYGRVEDAHMGICHMIAYAFMENAALQR
ncbi:MAG TPA: SIS domain-containing protein [Chryseosolibacter sp.]